MSLSIELNDCRIIMSGKGERVWSCACLSWTLSSRCVAEEMERVYFSLLSSFPAHLSVRSTVRCQHGSPGFNTHNLQLKESAKFSTMQCVVTSGNTGMAIRPLLSRCSIHFLKHLVEKNMAVGMCRLSPTQV